jgi:hypothetical protein
MADAIRSRSAVHLLIVADYTCLASDQAIAKSPIARRTCTATMHR